MKHSCVNIVLEMKILWWKLIPRQIVRFQLTEKWNSTFCHTTRALFKNICYFLTFYCSYACFIVYTSLSYNFFAFCSKAVELWKKTLQKSLIWTFAFDFNATPLFHPYEFVTKTTKLFFFFSNKWITTLFKHKKHGTQR